MHIYIYGVLVPTGNLFREERGARTVAVYGQDLIKKNFEIQILSCILFLTIYMRLTKFCSRITRYFVENKLHHLQI